MELCRFFVEWFVEMKEKALELGHDWTESNPWRMQISVDEADPNKEVDTSRQGHSQSQIFQGICVLNSLVNCDCLEPNMLILRLLNFLRIMQNLILLLIGLIACNCCGSFYDSTLDLLSPIEIIYCYR